MPVVSLITPLFDKGRYIVETIRSVQAQTLADWEMIVANNGSTDAGPERVRRLAADDCRVRLASSLKRGPGAARNAGLAQAVGEWVLFLDADDLIEPEHLTALVDAGSRGGAEIAAGGWKEFRDANPKQFEVKHPTGWNGKGTASAIAFTPWAVHAAIVRREWLRQDRLWPEQMDNLLAEDTVFWFRALQGARVVYSSSAHALYRRDTPSNRNIISSTRDWYIGLDAAAMANLKTLTDFAAVPDASQCESLMRLYEPLVGRAKREGAAELHTEVRGKYLHWLREARRRAPTKPALLARALFPTYFTMRQAR